jgi:hypothetical protein
MLRLRSTSELWICDEENGVLRLRGYALAWVLPQEGVLAAPLEGLTWRTPRVPSSNMCAVHDTLH